MKMCAFQINKYIVPENRVMCIIFTDTHLVVWLLSLTCIFTQGDANGVTVVESSFSPTLAHGMNEAVSCHVSKNHTNHVRCAWFRPDYLALGVEIVQNFLNLLRKTP